MLASRKWNKKAEPVTVTGYCNTRHVKNAAQKLCKTKWKSKPTEQNQNYKWYDSTYAQWNDASGMGRYVVFEIEWLFFLVILWWWFKHQQHLSVQMTERYIWKYFQLSSIVWRPVQIRSHTSNVIHVQNTIVSNIKYWNSDVNSCQYVVISFVYIFDI